VDAFWPNIQEEAAASSSDVDRFLHREGGNEGNAGNGRCLRIEFLVASSADLEGNENLRSQSCKLLQLRSVQGQSLERLVLISNAIGGDHAEAVSQCLGHAKVDREAAAPLAGSDAVHDLHTLGLRGESTSLKAPESRNTGPSERRIAEAGRRRERNRRIFAQVRRGSSNWNAGESETGDFTSLVDAGGTSRQSN
jgi:hypothetical protein